MGRRTGRSLLGTFGRLAFHPIGSITIEGRRFALLWRWTRSLFFHDRTVLRCPRELSGHDGEALRKDQRRETVMEGIACFVLHG